MAELDALSPLDGRYAAKVAELRPLLSEAGLIHHRIKVELRYLIALSEAGVCRQLTKGERALLAKIEASVLATALSRIKELEAECNHDVKACEYWLAEKFAGTSLKDLIPFIHFGLTSYDVNDTAYAMMLDSALDEVLLPVAVEVRARIAALARENAAIAMLGYTHGQPATPTTLGKEFAVFAERLGRQLKQLKGFMPTSKFSGATGTYAAQHIAVPDINWQGFAEKFLASLGLHMTKVATQIDPKDTFAELFDNLRRVNNILIDLSRDCWLYISMGYLAQQAKGKEVGSSTMPHKVNPIDFENSEGNLELADSMLSFLSDKLTKSRLQRDLSDSTVLRNIGVAFGHTILGWNSLLAGLSKVAPDKRRLAAELASHPEVLTEAVQTVLRRHGVKDAYDQLKELSRGKQLTLDSLRQFIRKLKLPEKEKKRLLCLEPHQYIGLARELAESVGK